ncbi:MAG: type II toxin-antitoxin system PemK/MazF family toxin [Chloroflexota bacterium]
MRGEVQDTRLDPVEVSELGGVRPEILISREALNTSQPKLIMILKAGARKDRIVCPSRVLVHAPEARRSVDTLVLGEWIRSISKAGLPRHRGSVTDATMLSKAPVTVPYGVPSSPRRWYSKTRD